MRTTLKDRLELVEAVYSGAVSRKQISLSKSARGRVLVAATIMLTASDMFLKPGCGYVVDGHYGKALRYLLHIPWTEGMPAEERTTHNHSATLLNASRLYGLHTSTNQGATSTVTLSPPRELEQLVGRMGVTPAIVEYLRQSDACALSEDKRTDALECLLASLPGRGQA